MYDLMGPYAVYLAIRQRHEHAVPVIVLGGIIMDGLSGGIFGMYLSIYLWMYAGVRQVIKYFHAENILIVMILIFLCVSFESAAIAFSVLVLTPVIGPAERLLPIVGKQVFWGTVTGPFLLFLLVRCDRLAHSMEKRHFTDRYVLGKR
ncbi:hypothetical protein LJC71_06730 [Desulfosarcina sp. OttesenSCG-928-A07]|nr:hypothetical protein [Desulfosarcina sp. OttesenSCG-928-A07]